ncbi:zinc finger protein 91-like [Cydia pomonella]|uniref:zinc finger protein 91-like n=1 Tax=Cydia pomonella TaxID=82600 RepID=UPI002ADD840E|nr:zinc finger protein 91-like [Cydia pomonella]
MEVFLYNSTVCRLCGEENDNGTLLYSSEENSQNLSEIINTYLPIKVSDDGELPRTICPGCTIQIEATVEFITLIINGQKIIRELHQRETEYKKTLFNHAVASEPEIITEKIVYEINTSDGVYQVEHPIALQVAGLDKPKRKRGRPPKKPKTPEELAQEAAARQQVEESKVIQKEEELQGKRRRKTPTRFKEAVQGKELERIFKEEGVTDGDETDNEAKPDADKLPVSKEPEVIGHMEASGELVVVVKGKGRGRPKGRMRPTREQCAICGMEFSCVGRYMSHVAAHGPVQYRCGCGQTFPTRLMFTTHQRNAAHEGQTVIPCATQLRPDLPHQAHVHHAPEERRTRGTDCHPVRHAGETHVACRMCRTAAARPSPPGSCSPRTRGTPHTRDRLSSRAPRRMQINPKTSPIKTEQPPEPSEELPSIEKLVSNVQDAALPAAVPDDAVQKVEEPDHKPEVASEETPAEAEVETETVVLGPSGKPKLKCPQCDKMFSNKQSRSLHIKAVHEGAKPYVCVECGASFAYPRSLALHAHSHRRAQPSKGFACDLCGKVLNHPSSVVYHKEAEHTGQRYVCGKCGKLFKHKQLLQRHQLVHSQARPYSCKICSTSFKTKANLLNHALLHSGVKRFSCELCKHRFAHKTSLTLHMRWHSGLKPYTCKTCGKSFSQKGNLSEHERIHTGEKPYQCAQCPRRFTTSSQHRLHARRHQPGPERPHACDRCGKRYVPSHPHGREAVPVRAVPAALHHVLAAPPARAPPPARPRAPARLRPLREAVRTVTSTRARSRTSARSARGASPRPRSTACTRAATSPAPSARTPATAAGSGTYRHIHTGEKPYQCAQCPRRFTTSSQHRLHARRHQPGPERPHACDRCGKRYVPSHPHGREAVPVRAVPAALHHVLAAPPARAPPPARPRAPARLRPLREAVRTVTSTRARSRTSARSARGASPRPRSTACTRAATSPAPSARTPATAAGSGTYRHIHTGEKPYQCAQCPRRFTTSSQHRLHARRHQPGPERPHACDRCGKRYVPSHPHGREAVPVRAVPAALHHVLAAPPARAPPPARPRAPARLRPLREAVRTVTSTRARSRTSARSARGASPRPRSTACTRAATSPAPSARTPATAAGSGTYRHIHTGEKPYQCAQCPRRFTTSSQHRLHARRHQPGPERPHACDRCGKRYVPSHPHGREAVPVRAVPAALHHVLAAPPARAPPPARPRAPARLRPLREAVRTVTSTRARSRTSARSARGASPRPRSTACTRAATSPAPSARTPATAAGSGTYRHIHTGEKPYQCAQCPRRFTTSSQHRLHARRHQPGPERPHACDRCGKRYVPSHPHGREAVPVRAVPAALHHVLAAPPARAPPPARPRAPARLRPLREAVRTVTLGWRINAHVHFSFYTFFFLLVRAVVFRFVCRSSWLAHMRREARAAGAAGGAGGAGGAARHRCAACGRGFAERWALLKHARRHTGERPFRCPLCPRAFADCSNLNKHKKQVHKQVSLLVDKHLPPAPASPQDERVIYVAYDVDSGPTAFHIVEADQMTTIENETVLKDTLYSGSSLLRRPELPDPEPVEQMEEVEHVLEEMEPVVLEESEHMPVTDEQGNPLHFTMQDGTRLAITSADGKSLQVITQDGQTIPVEINGFADEEEIENPDTIVHHLNLQKTVDTDGAAHVAHYFTIV